MNEIFCYNLGIRINFDQEGEFVKEQSTSGREMIPVTKITVKSISREAFLSSHQHPLRMFAVSSFQPKLNFGFFPFLEIHWENFQELFSCAEWKIKCKSRNILFPWYIISASLCLKMESRKTFVGVFLHHPCDCLRQHGAESGNARRMSVCVWYEMFVEFYWDRITLIMNRRRCPCSLTSSHELSIRLSCSMHGNIILVWKFKMLPKMQIYSNILFQASK